MCSSWSSLPLKLCTASIVLDSKETLRYPHFDLSTEGFLSKCLFNTAIFSSKSQDVDVLKTRLTQYDNFHNGLVQQDATECLLMIIEIIKKGSVTCFETIENARNFSSGVSLSDFLLSIILESVKYVS